MNVDPQVLAYRAHRRTTRTIAGVAWLGFLVLLAMIWFWRPHASCCCCCQRWAMTPVTVHIVGSSAFHGPTAATPAPAAPPDVGASPAPRSDLHPSIASAPVRTAIVPGQVYAVAVNGTPIKIATAPQPPATFVTITPVGGTTSHPQADVPEPSMWWLFLIAIVGTIGIAWSQRRGGR